ncbi:uncharacterized protein A4U43_C05F32890 [Asparagus officinalis]|uniref:Flowering time control protein FCA n=2 Tax=Asparagus officinalis TaxID=4686 RepID=A0A5P1EYT9_ASPOF|nr:uncharacterized protein A4U43_C05F32890 [Asparagus officinalis]
MREWLGREGSRLRSNEYFGIEVTRLGISVVSVVSHLKEDKLFVASLNKRATEQEIAEIFSPYGHVEDVYLMRDELKQSRGCGFVKFSNREMAAAAMNALHGTYVMRGCDQPLIVRFADPKRPRPEQRGGGPAFGGPGFGHRSETATVIGPTAKFDEPIGGRMPPNAWGSSPQSRGPSSQAASQGFGTNPSAKGGMVETSSVATGPLGETGLTGGHQPNFAATPQQGFNPSVPQMHPGLGPQMLPLQKPLMTPQHLPSSLQPPQNQQISGSHPQGQTLQPQMQQMGQLQIPQSTGLPSSQTLPSQQLPGFGGQASQSLNQLNASANALQIPMGLSQQGVAAMANQQQLPSSTISHQLLQRPIQQLPSHPPHVLLQQQAQALQSSYQSSQQAIFQLQQQLQLMQQAGLTQQQIPQNAKQQQSPWSGPQPISSAPANTTTAVVPSAAPVTSSVPVTTTSAVPLTCNWTEHTSPQGFKYYYNSVTQESKWEKPEEYSAFEQQQQQQKMLLFQQQQQKVAVQQLQSPAQTQTQTQNQPNQQIPQAQQVQNQMQLRQQAQMQQLLQPSLPYQAAGVGNQQNIQDFNYAQLQAVNPITDNARSQQGIHAAQELSWQNKP